MKKFIFAAIFSIGIMFSTFYLHNLANADELDEITKQIAELQEALESSKKATVPLESQLNSLTASLSNIEAQVSEIERDLSVKREDIAAGYLELGQQQESFNLIVKNSYIKTYSLSPLLLFFSSADPSEFIKFLTYQKQDAERDKSAITNTALKLVDLEERKRILESEEKRLAGLKETLDKERIEVEKVVLGAKDYQAELSGQIAELSARQQEIINKRSGSFTFTLGSGELADEYLSSAKGFQESAPSGYFAVFSFGGYSHRKGMSQYGARGRAESGQSYKQILQKYYGKEPVSKNTDGNIKVAGYGDMDFETTYLYGIAEMPSSWHLEALKAQAIAARTYAYRYKEEGSEICTNEACQVFNKSKSDNVPSSWKEAVDSTKGEVLEDVVTYYSSTTGGYLATSGWDTTDGSGGGNFIDKSYERLGNSPWLEKMWWREGYSVTGNTCGRSTPWLSPEEMADIVNAHLVLSKGSGDEASRISPVTTSCWGGNPYSMSELRTVAEKYGGISSATSISVVQGNGVTNGITINGISINPSDFRKAFNLRAPGFLRIPQYPGTYGPPFFNVVKK